ncbi:MAG: 30S ribosome-binding factor RbfA [Hyphomicrobiales bacterium]|nr:30S ribosome-binding factor RbfA [Hyphomicrobiales bacterium]
MSKQQPAKGPSQRQLRVGELIRHALAEMFMRGDIHEPELADVILQVTEVKVSPDLKHATAFVSPLDAGARDRALAALNRHGRFIRGEVGKKLDLRYAPDIAFKLDTTLDHAERVQEILRSEAVARDLQ